MGNKRRSFGRRPPQRPYNKMYLIATEGEKTEKEYFKMLNSRTSIVKVKPINAKGNSSPNKVLTRMKANLSELRMGDEAWLVVDKDNWSDEQLAELHRWAQTKDVFGLALSNPCFEFWLLLHFEPGRGVHDTRTCHTRLKGNIPGYNKGINCDDFPEVKVKYAIENARSFDSPPCRDWPRGAGSTVYRLVEKIVSGL